MYIKAKIPSRYIYWVGLMAQKVFIMGATGRVGSALVSQIYDREDTNPLLHRNPTSVVGVSSSTSYLYDPNGLEESLVRCFSSRKVRGRGYGGISDITELLRQHREPVSVVDATASPAMLEMHLAIIGGTRHGVVTANKLPLTIADFTTFNALTSEAQRYGFRCTVMAGADAVDKMRDLRDLCDPPLEIIGSFSGTIGHILTRLQEGMRLSESVREAMQLGYTEPNPAKDLDGSDVANKIVILARTAGFDVGSADVKVSTFVPHDYLESPSAEVLLERLRDLDGYFKKEVNRARAAGNTLRYIARLALHNGLPQLRVGIEEVPIAGPLGMLSGTANQIGIKTKVYNPVQYIVQAPGSGPELTAQNLRRDLLYQVERRSVVHSIHVG